MTCWNGYGNLMRDTIRIWVGKFTQPERDEILFYYRGNHNWHLGSYNGSEFEWSTISNTRGYGNLMRSTIRIWTGKFTQMDLDEVLFYYNNDGNWWNGSYSHRRINWTRISNTGRSFKSVVRLHVKILTTPTIAIQTMVARMRDVFETANIRVDEISTENLTLPLLNDLDIGKCSGLTTEEQNQLFENRNQVRNDDIVVYFIRSTSPPSNGCASHPLGRPGALVVQGATQWTLAHEVGHVLGLTHVNNNNRLMTGNGTANITNPPPNLVRSEINTMDNSNLTIDC